MSATRHAGIVEPYLFFEGRCEEAIEFYRRALDAEVIMLMHYKDSPDPAMRRPECGNKVMHANLRIGGSRVMVSDGRCEGKPGFQGFALSLSVATEAEADLRFAALADGGQVVSPLAETFFSKRFGMVSDRFGVLWIILVGAK